MDRDRKIVYWNHGAERILGCLRQRVTGRYCGDNTLAHCDERETQLWGDACPSIDCMRDGQPREAAVYLRHRAGHRVPVYVRAIPLRDPAGAGGYFKDPTGASKMVGTDMQGAGESFALSREDMPKLKEELQKARRRIDDVDKLRDQIEMTVTAEGLRIELPEAEPGTFFETGSPVPSANGRELLIALAGELGALCRSCQPSATANAAEPRA